MPRRPRVHLAGQPVHIVQRGHNRQPCFFCEDDYRAYLHWLDLALVKHRCALHAYVLMTNHVHLLMTPETPASVPLVLIAIGRRYVQYINKAYRRTGTLWDSRYKSSLVQGDVYLLSCQRYIELNPVRAGMVKDPAEYPWSSYRANGLGQRAEGLTAHPLYTMLGANLSERLRAYRSMFRPELDADAIGDIRQALNQSQPLGDSRFHAEIEAALGARCQPRPRGRPRKRRPLSAEQDGQLTLEEQGVPEECEPGPYL